MRSRYSAFAVGDADYLRDTWARGSRPDFIELDDAITWTQLEIVETVDGGPFDTTGIVEFRARYRHRNVQAVRQERSRFTREDGRWVYVSGETRIS